MKDALRGNKGSSSCGTRLTKKKSVCTRRPLAFRFLSRERSIGNCINESSCDLNVLFSFEAMLQVKQFNFKAGLS